MFGFVGYRKSGLSGLSGLLEKKGYDEEGNDEALIPNCFSNIYIILSAAAAYNSFIQIQKVMGLT